GRPGDARHAVPRAPDLCELVEVLRQAALGHPRSLLAPALGSPARLFVSRTASRRRPVAPATSARHPGRIVTVRPSAPFEAPASTDRRGLYEVVVAEPVGVPRGTSFLLAIVPEKGARVRHVFVPKA